jgi:hypothetical protein
MTTNVLDMTIESKGVTDVPVTEAIKDNPELKALFDRVLSGETSLVSPCDGMYVPWTEDEKRQFSRVIATECEKMKARRN